MLNQFQSKSASGIRRVNRQSSSRDFIPTVVAIFKDRCSPYLLFVSLSLAISPSFPSIVFSSHFLPLS